MKEPGKKIDLFLAKAEANMKVLRKKAAKLERQGVLMAYPHFKAGTKKMFLNTPTDGSGRRKFIYVGTDEKAQAAALAKIARHYQRERVLADVQILARELEEKERELSRIHSGAAALVQQTAKALSDADRPKEKLAGVTPRRGPGARPVTPKYPDGEGCPFCGEEDCEESCTAAIAAGSRTRRSIAGIR